MMGTVLSIRWDVDPVLIDLFGKIQLRYYGLLFVTGIWLGYKAVQRMYRQEDVPLAKLDSLTTYIIVGTILGARIGHCLFYDFDYFSQHPLEIILPFTKGPDGWEFTGISGLASHGGVIGVFLAILYYCKKQGERLLTVLDRVAVGSAITACFIRLGNLFNSEIVGRPTGTDTGFIFVRVDELVRHPTQLYEAFSYLLIFSILLPLYHQRKRGEGFIFGLFFVLLFSARFIIEFFKENQVAFEDGMSLNMGQWLSIPFVIVGLVMMWRSRGHFPNG